MSVVPFSEKSGCVNDSDTAKPRKVRGFAPSLASQPASPAMAGTHPVSTVIGLGRRGADRLLVMLCAPSVPDQTSDGKTRMLFTGRSPEGMQAQVWLWLR
jgi:hypothetical protein